ncbi:Ribosomal protein S4e [Macleaya cordata]|uniref:Ribosomal protein S4e n=1 Tax=Macleaya cordata TaxID=56857 RepID=A0A200PYF7_MACCD|nr:Ribosomal protein S4e [Macleaya cordata]
MHCKIQSVESSPNCILYIKTHDGREIRSYDPRIEANDTIKLELEAGANPNIYIGWGLYEVKI